MQGIGDQDFQKKRRAILLGAGALALQTYTGAIARPVKPSRETSRRVLKLSDFGGTPEADSETIISAFNKAFTQLKSMGGGTLKVAPGTYSFGSLQSGSPVRVSDLSNVLVSAYGATLQMTTTATTTMTTPVFFNFQNPNNVTFAGMSFYDFGTSLDLRKGAVCFVVEAQRKCYDFKTVDCTADSVIAFLQSNLNSYPYLFERFDIQATIKNSYYGLAPHKSGRFSKCNLNCVNVRRAFISHSTRDWNITVTTNRTSGLGSNAHVVLDAFPNWPVQDCVVNIIASGALNGYNSLGSICHQGPDGSYSVARNVKFNITINNATSAATTGFISFTAEPESGGGIRSSTVSAWENIQVKGVVNGTYGGRIVANPSVSSASTNSIYVTPKLAALQSMRGLPKYIHTGFTQNQG